MDNGNMVSFRALRILTFTILFKAMIDTVILISRMAGSDLMYTAGKFADFINIVACVLCFVGIVALSKRFIYSHRIMVAALILECVTILLATVELRLMLSSHEAAAAIVEWMTLISIAVGRLLIGAAFFFLMTGFGKILREESDPASAVVSEKLGAIYLFFNSIYAVLGTTSIGSDSVALAAVAVVLEITGIILEVLMYRRASQAAFLIWKNRRPIISKGWI